MSAGAIYQRTRFEARTLARVAKVLDIPVIASLNGVSEDGWLDYALQLEQAGAAAIELNIYILPTDPAESGREIEQRYLDIARRVRAKVSIPVAVKLPPFLAAVGNFVAQLETIGADGVVLFNRFFRPDLDIERLEFKRELALSTPAEISLPLTWTALLSRRVGISLAAGTGVDSYIEVVKFLLAGADVVTTASALLRYGPQQMRTLTADLDQWLSQNALGSVAQIRGRVDATHVEQPDVFLRTQYLHAVSDYAALQHLPLRPDGRATSNAKIRVGLS